MGVVVVLVVVVVECVGVYCGGVFPSFDCNDVKLFIFYAFVCVANHLFRFEISF